MTPKLMTSAFTALRSAASSFHEHIAKGFSSSWSSVPTVSNNAASDRAEDASDRAEDASDRAEDASDSDDEWGIVHSPKVHPARPRASRVQLTTKSDGVEVSLALSVVACHRAPPGLRLQQSRATWTFSSVDGYSRSTQSPRCSIRFVQAPTFTVDLLMLSQFDANHASTGPCQRFCYEGYPASLQ
ncbi:hypothetical protein PF004_g19648 [Phytophthora fragariae]|uniref:Uncharacterized protein n=1 Tax=Phytophthora fragariae TaxID=53985 RepID=A0A6G0N873_9STRA|nr:hypothetical protein PF004_g19648 [Phytophthora fragariae]